MTLKVSGSSFYVRIIIGYVLTAVVVFLCIGRWVTGFNFVAASLGLLAAEAPVGTYLCAAAHAKKLFVRLWTVHGWLCIAGGLLSAFAANILQPSDVINGFAVVLGSSLLSFHLAMLTYAIAVLVGRNRSLDERLVAMSVVVTTIVMVMALIFDDL